MSADATPRKEITWGRTRELQQLQESFTLEIHGDSKAVQVFVRATDRKITNLTLRLPDRGNRQLEMNLLALPKGVSLEDIGAVVRVELADYIMGDR